MTSSSAKNVNADAGWRVEIGGFDSFAPDIECCFVVEGAARGVKDVRP